MAAPRKFTDAQRQAIFRLHEAGLTSQQIADSCAKGTAGAEPFTIARRTVSYIVSRMAQEAGVEFPTEPGDISSTETVLRFPERIARLIDAEVTRLERKPLGRLTPADAQRMREIVQISGPLQKRLEGRIPRPTRAGNDTRAQPRQESALERLEREEREAGSGKSDLSHARTSPDKPDPAPISVPTRPPAAAIGPSPAGNALAAARAVAAEHGLPTEAFDRAAERGGESPSGGC